MTTTVEWRKWNAMQTKPITNYDLLIRRSPEELAEFLWKRDIAIVEKASKAAGFTFTVDREECLKNVLDWLKQEVEDGRN